MVKKGSEDSVCDNNNNNNRRHHKDQGQQSSVISNLPCLFS